MVASGWGRDALVDEAEGVPGRLRRLLADGHRVGGAADGSGSVDQLARRLRDAGVEVVPMAGDEVGKDPGASLVVAPVESGFVLPESRLAVVAVLSLIHI